jgi:surface antigen
MPKYSVLVTRDITESTDVLVEAKSVEEAETIALAKARDDVSLEWTIDDGSVHPEDAYVTNVEEKEEGEG